MDPHVWLDPVLYAQMVDGVRAALAEVAPRMPRRPVERRRVHPTDRRTRERLPSGLADCERTLIVTNHAAFGYLAAAYGLTQEAISGLAPDAEPSAQRLAELKDLVEREGVTTVFTEDLVSPKVAETLADEAGVQTAPPAYPGGLTDDEAAAGADYGSQMRENLTTLREALGCG